MYQLLYVLLRRITITPSVSYYAFHLKYLSQIICHSIIPVQYLIPFSIGTLIFKVVANIWTIYKLSTKHFSLKMLFCI